jgi:O-antigen ligase
MRLEQQLFVFVLSALWGVGVAYDPSPAAVRFAFIFAGVLLAIGLARLPSDAAWLGRRVQLLPAAMATLPTLLAVYFLLTNDWTEPVEKVAWLTRLQEGLAAAAIGLPFPALHPNVVGGVLAMLLPLQAAVLFVSADHRPTMRRRAIGIASFALSVAAFLGTRLRGAWLALAIAGSLWSMWRVSRWLQQKASVSPRATGFGVAVGLILIVLLGTAGAREWIAARPDRALVWSNSWHLAQDYFFTGVGLGSFAMPYSSYALLLHVPHTAHAHNLFLDIWLAHGLAGLLIFVWIMAAAIVRGVSAAAQTTRNASDRRTLGWHTAAVISALVVLLHGLIDDPYYGYGGGGALLLFVPVALLSRVPERVRPSTSTKSAHRRSGRAVLWASAAATMAVLALFPWTRAVYHANVGALLQTRAELAVYRWPAWAVQDAVRRVNTATLAPAIDHYLSALALAPDNAVANRRLGQIELSLGDYDSARAHLEAAHRVLPEHHATRQMLGESLALAGDHACAARLWETVPLIQEQLAIRREWYDSIGNRVRAGRVRGAIQQVLSTPQ